LGLLICNTPCALRICQTSRLSVHTGMKIIKAVKNEILGNEMACLLLASITLELTNAVSRVDPLINDACLLRMVMSLPRKREISLLSVRKKKNKYDIACCSHSFCFYSYTLLSWLYYIEREKGKFMRRQVVNSAYIGWLGGGGGVVFNRWRG
jgi:hypothetical protein